MMEDVWYEKVDDEGSSGSPQPVDALSQPAQEIVDPRDPDSFEDRERTSMSGHDEPRQDDTV